VARPHPANVDQLQAVLTIALDHDCNLWSITDPSGDCGVLGPSECDVVLVQPQRMDQIIEVDRVSGTALVDAGVTYRQLYDHLHTHLPPLYFSFPKNPKRVYITARISRLITLIA
jgi:4-cresol dehydrogenase (hydroxylating)